MKVPQQNDQVLSCNESYIVQYKDFTFLEKSYYLKENYSKFYILYQV